MTDLPSGDDPTTPKDTEAAEAAAQEAESRAAAARTRAQELRRLAEAGVLAPTQPETATETLTATAAASGRRIHWVAVSAAAMVAAICASAGLSGAMLWQRHTAQQQQQRIAEYSAVAKQSAINLMSLDYNDAKASVQRVIDGATGKFKDDFSAQSDALVKAMQDAKVVTTVAVQSVAVEQYSADSAVVLVAAQSQATNVKDERKEPQKFRVVVTLATDNGRLKASQVDFV